MTGGTRAPLKITLLFFVGGCAWIFLSDLLLARLVVSPVVATRISIYKGWGFMLFSSCLLYWLLARHMSVLRQWKGELVRRNDELTSIQETLRFSHRQFLALVNSIEGIVWECDPSTLQYLFVSQKAEQMLGFSISNWLEDPLFLLNHLHPEDRDGVWKALEGAAHDGKDTCLEYRIVAASGTVVWMRNNVTVITEESAGRACLRGVMYDITPQKMVEEEIQKLNLDLEQRVRERTAQLEISNGELQAVFQALPDVLFRIDGDGTILDYKNGSTGAALTGDPAVVGSNIGQALPSCALEPLREILQAHAVQTGVSSFEYMTTSAEGDVYFEARLLRFREREFIVLIRNITGRKQTEQEIRALNVDLQQRAGQLQDINEELEAFSYSVSHDLRTPLRHIDGFSRALQEDCIDSLDSNGRMYVERVRAAAQRMGHLIDDMLKLANVTRSDLVKQRVDLSAVARIISLELQQAQPERMVSFVIEENVVGYCDPWLVRVVLGNLIQNAWKYTGRKHDARIEFGVTGGEEPVYHVRDNGAGFDMTYAGKLFNAFQRLHGVEEFEGNGIGLATVQRVIRRHGGRVWGEGSVGEGASFYFSLGRNEGDDTGEAWK